MGKLLTLKRTNEGHTSRACQAQHLDKLLACDIQILGTGIRVYSYHTSVQQEFRKAANLYTVNYKKLNSYYTVPRPFRSHGQ